MSTFVLPRLKWAKTAHSKVVNWKKYIAFCCSEWAYLSLPEAGGKVPNY